jgi:acetyl esterase/lipase
MTLRRRSLLALAAAPLSGCSGAQWLNALSTGGAAEVHEGVAYGPHARHRADVYQPAGTLPPGGWPTVIFFYGGSWNSGERADYRFVGEALAGRGLLTAVADYRLHPEVRFPDFLLDCARAHAWWAGAAAGFGGDRQRLHLMGHSAGAYNAAMLALDARWLGQFGHSPKSLAGWVGLAGPYDFLPISNPQAQPVFFHPDYPPRTQPVAEVTAGAPRAFLGAPRDDKLVNPVRSTVGLATRLQQAGVPVEMRLYDRVNHALVLGALARPLRWLAPVLDDVSAFLLRAPAPPAA